jgi:hypothetical protein
MLRFIGILFFASLLTSCSFFNTDNNKANARYSNCKELKSRLLFINATNDERIATQRAAELDTLNRSYHENGCG